MTHTPPSGWYHFGTFCNVPKVGVEFSSRLDEDGDPSWERPTISGDELVLALISRIDDQTQRAHDVSNAVDALTLGVEDLCAVVRT